jgi:hypothetical protein
MSRVTENPAAVADQLEKLNAVTNDGRGSSVCTSVIMLLRRNDVPGAVSHASLDYDKVWQYPPLAALFEEVGLLADRPML